MNILISKNMKPPKSSCRKSCNAWHNMSILPEVTDDILGPSNVGTADCPRPVVTGLLSSFTTPKGAHSQPASSWQTGWGGARTLHIFVIISLNLEKVYTWHFGYFSARKDQGSIVRLHPDKKKIFLLARTCVTEFPYSTTLKKRSRGGASKLSKGMEQLKTGTQNPELVKPI